MNPSQPIGIADGIFLDGVGVNPGIKLKEGYGWIMF